VKCLSLICKLNSSLADVFRNSSSLTISQSNKSKSRRDYWKVLQLHVFSSVLLLVNELLRPPLIPSFPFEIDFASTELGFQSSGLLGLRCMEL